MSLIRLPRFSNTRCIFPRFPIKLRISVWGAMCGKVKFGAFISPSRQMTSRSSSKDGIFGKWYWKKNGKFALFISPPKRQSQAIPFTNGRRTVRAVRLIQMIRVNMSSLFFPPIDETPNKREEFRVCRGHVGPFIKT